MRPIIGHITPLQLATLTISSSAEENYIATAMPYLEIDDYEPVWADAERNRKWVERFLPNSTEVGKWGTQSVWHYQRPGQPSAYYFIVRNGLVIYGVRYIVTPVKGFSAICQTSVWRDPNSALAVSVAAWVFFDRLLPKFGSIISDKSQSREGKTFWLRRAVEAMRADLRVYLVDLHSGAFEAVEELDLQNDEWAAKVWSTTDARYQHKRLLITKIELRS